MKLPLLTFLLFFSHVIFAQDSIRVTLCTHEIYGCYPSYSREVEHFDSLGRITETEHYYKDGCHTPPDSIMKFTWLWLFTYDANGNIIVDESRYPTLSVFKLNSYDLSGRKIATLYQQVTLGIPQVTGRDSTVYDANGNTVWFLSESYIGGNWDTTEFVTRQYDINGRLIDFYRYWHNDNDEYHYQHDTIPYQNTTYSNFISNGSLIDSARIYKKYYSNGRLEEVINSDWDDPSQTWNFLQRNRFEYDTIANITYHYQFDCPDTLCQDSIEKTISTYDSLGRLIDMKDYEADGGWILIGRFWKNYSGNLILDDGYYYVEQGCDDAEYNYYTYNLDGVLIHTQSVQVYCNPDTSTCDYYILTGDSILLVNQSALTACPFDTIYPVITLLGGHEPYNLQWTPSAGILDPDSLSPRIVTDSSTTYQLTVTDSIGTVENILVPVNVVQSTLNLGSDTSVCKDVPFLLSANGTYLSYHWSNGSTSGLYSVNTTTPGIQSIWLQVQQGQCFFTDTIFVTVDVCFGITEVSNSLISIYPNPSSGEIKIDLAETNPLEIILIDSAGRIIETLDPTKNNFTLKLKSGIYFARVMHERGVSYVKIIIN